MEFKQTLLAIVMTLVLNHSQAALLITGTVEPLTNADGLNYSALTSGSKAIPGWLTTNAESTQGGPVVSQTPLVETRADDTSTTPDSRDNPPTVAAFQTITPIPGQQYQVSFGRVSDKYFNNDYPGKIATPGVAVSRNSVVVFSATNNFAALTNRWQTLGFGINTTRTETPTPNPKPADASVIWMENPAVDSSSITLPFTIGGEGASSFKLLQSNQVNGPWTTNSAAALSTNAPAETYSFSLPLATIGEINFFRVQSP